MKYSYDNEHWWKWDHAVENAYIPALYFTSTIGQNLLVVREQQSELWLEYYLLVWTIVA